MNDMRHSFAALFIPTDLRVQFRQQPKKRSEDCDVEQRTNATKNNARTYGTEPACENVEAMKINAGRNSHHCGYDKQNHKEPID